MYENRNLRTSVKLILIISLWPDKSYLWAYKTLKSCVGEAIYVSHFV